MKARLIGLFCMAFLIQAGCYTSIDNLGSDACPEGEVRLEKGMQSVCLTPDVLCVVSVGGEIPCEGELWKYYPDGEGEGEFKQICLEEPQEGETCTPSSDWVE